MDNLRSEIREKFKPIFENSFLNIFVYNLEGTIIDVNHIILDTFGYKREEVVNKPFREFINKEDLPQAIDVIKELRKIGKISKRNIYRIKHANGSEKILEIHGIPYKVNDKIKAIIAFGQDITKKKNAEDLLKESEELFRNIAEQSIMGMVIIQDDVVKYINQKAADIFGYTPEEILKWNPNEFLKTISPNDKKMVSNQVKRKQNGKKDVINHYTFEGLTKSGVKIWLENFSKTITYLGKTADLVMLIDTTEKKIAEEKLKESQKRYKNLFDSSPYSIVLIDLEGIIIDVNETANKYLGYSRDEVIGMSFLDLPLYEPHIVPLLNIRLKQYASGKKMKPIVLSLKKTDGTVFWVNPKVSLIEIDGKKHIQIIYEDITEKVEAEKKLKESEEKYRLAYKRENFYKDIFAHDTRNILQGMLSSIELCKLSIKNSKNLETIELLLDECKQQVLRGSNLVKNVKKFSELEDSKRPLMKINVVKFLNEAIKIAQTYSNEKDIKISLDSESDQYFIKADELITDVFENIIINAIQHNPDKNINISIKVKETKEKNLQIEFIDNGPGIPDYKKERIFERNNETNTSVSGTGLGLYLVSLIIKDYDAKIKVKNRIPDDRTKGSVFLLTFPQI